MKNRKWYDPVLEFAGHMLAGAIIFIIIALIATGLSLFVKWLESIGAPPGVTTILTTAEYILLVVDVVLFLAWVISSAYHAWRGH